MRNKKENLDSYTLEEIMLMQQEEDERLQKNPLDSSANSRYNMYSQIIEQRLAKLNA
jgi:hypothetical protein